MASKYPSDLVEAAEVASLCPEMNARSRGEVRELIAGNVTEPIQHDNQQYLGQQSSMMIQRIG